MTKSEVRNVIDNEEAQIANDKNALHHHASIIFISQLNTIEVIRAAFDSYCECEQWVTWRMKKLRVVDNDKFYVMYSDSSYYSDEFHKWFATLED